MAAPKSLIVGVDVRSRENNRAHRTEEIDRQRLIVRRGQPFSVALQCSDSLPPERDLVLILQRDEMKEVAMKPQSERGTAGKWWFRQQGAQNEILLTVHSPANAPIGQYRLAVAVMSRDGRILEKTDFSTFYVLFNPWCKDDAVHLPDESLLQEYIMNEHGVIYIGSWDEISGLPWNFGQFEDNVLDICFEILDKSNSALRDRGMDMSQRWDPVHISRTVVAMVNSRDDHGVLRGRWGKTFPDGVAPTRWMGSVPILQKWSNSKNEVKYGQCWVFAAVACSVLRCLGIPTRCITNFSSAHDSDGNLSLDMLFNENFESLGRGESTWNFHCWIESWMRREDLPKGYDGWQVLDATPQELSDGMYRCGPCPVKAIKEGDLSVKYDAPFVFAEVNADIIHWIVQRDGKKRQLRSNTNSVGRNISTKSVYGDNREDVTLQYKYPEGSEKEREVYNKAGRPLSQPAGREPQPGQLQLSIKHAKPVFGTDFDIIFELENVGGEEVSANLNMVAKGVTYNSVHVRECQRHTASVAVPPHKVHREVLRMRYDQYAPCVSDHHIIRAIGMVDAAGQNEPILQMLNITLSMPELHVKVPGWTILYAKVTAYISFKNPLPVQLKGGVFTVEGAGLLSTTEILVHDVIAPGQEVSVTLTFTPMRVGTRKLLVDFDSDRLKDVKGVSTVVVRRKTPLLSPFFPNTIFG